MLLVVAVRLSWSRLRPWPLFRLNLVEMLVRSRAVRWNRLNWIRGRSRRDRLDVVVGVPMLLVPMFPLDRLGIDLRRKGIPL